MFSIRELFVQKFQVEPVIIRSPGRINIIGEHTDYNEGFVLPASIDKHIYIAVSKRSDEIISFYSVEFKEEFNGLISLIEPVTQTWVNYVLGIVDQLKKRGFQLGGFNLVVDGDIPIGAGLSSSAAFECSTAFALNEIFKLGIGKMEIVEIAQQAEHSFIGLRCGIMDMFTSVFGRKNSVIKLDCRSLEYEYKPLNLIGYKIVLFNTNIKHHLASSEYNTRREQCEHGVELIKKHYPCVKSLRDASLEMLNEYVANEDEIVYKRCKYVVEENGRLLSACEYLQAGDIRSLGRLMFESHDGLSNLYEVSCKELDYLVDAVKTNSDVLGSRMMGGGFGGCTINLVKEEAISDLQEKLSCEYKLKVGLDLSTYVAQIDGGTEAIEIIQ
jgi:galactokinase